MGVVHIAAISCFCIVWATAANLRTASSTSNSESLPVSLDAKINDNGPCQSDLFEVCNLSYPTTYQGIFDARMCLWANREKVTYECLQYLSHESPSIIEPCYDPIAKFCHDVVPGENRIHNCLREKASDFLSSECQEIVERDFQWSSTTPNDFESTFTYEKNSGDDYVASNPDYDDVDTITSKNEKYAEEAAEFAYLMKKLHHQQMEDGNSLMDKSEVASKLLDVVAFQDFLTSLSILPLMQQLHDFLGHLNEEMGILEDYLFKMLSSADLPDEGDSMTSDMETDETYYYESDDCGKSKEQLIAISLSDDCEGDDDCTAKEKDSIHIYLSDVVMQEKDTVSEEDIVTGDHIFRESQLASTLTADDEEWRKASKMFSLPTIMPLSSELFFNAPKQLMQVMVQTTMTARSTLAAASSMASLSSTSEEADQKEKAEEQPRLRGSSVKKETGTHENRYSPVFLESLRAIVRNALQDPRQ